MSKSWLGAATLCAVTVAAFCTALSAADKSRRAQVADPPLLPIRQAPNPSFSMPGEIERAVPLLKRARGSRWPMILWQAGSFEPQPVDVYRMMLARGLTQHIRLEEKMIPTAKALQEAGSPVIMMQGEGGAFPYSVAGDRKEWAHQFDEGFSSAAETHACPAITRGWAINADRIRATLQQFKDVGVTVNAVWMDWEVEPAIGEDRYEQAKHCARCRATLPMTVLATAEAFEDYCTRRYVELVGTYLAAPVTEIFPACSVTNWGAVVSSPQQPVRGWQDGAFTSRVPPNFTATNPVAYGISSSFVLWKPEWPLDREHVDQMYTHLLLTQVSSDSLNRKDWAAHMTSIPWVVRWCAAELPPRDLPPIMSRERYREVLRHLWLRGIAGMQVFNHVEPGYEEMALFEVQDAVQIYDEMLAYREFIDDGEPLNLNVPEMQHAGVLWSGLRRGDRAVVRMFKQGGGKAQLGIEPWPGKRIRLAATAAGETYLLKLQKDGRVTAAGTEQP